MKIKFIFGILVWLCLIPAAASAEPTREEAIALVLAAAHEQIGVTRSYDPAYRRLDYPGGDVPLETGVCTDVLIRAFRAAGTDLQKLVHEDMRKNFHRYPNHWGARAPDKNIDHRRVPNLMTYFKRAGKALRLPPASFEPGDIVAWRLSNNATHIGIVSEVRVASKHYKIIHNIGFGTVLEDVLYAYDIIGHYRYF